MKIILSSVLCCMLFWAVQAQELSKIEVMGNSEISIMPDEATIQINLREKALQVKDATNALNKKTKSIEDALKKTNLDNYRLTVDNYFVNVNRIYGRGTSRDSGYVASQTIKIKVMDTGADLIKITETLHQTTNMSFSIQFGISDKSKKEVESKLLTMALEDAVEKAKVIAGTLGLGEVKVHHVNYVPESRNYFPVMREARAMMASDAANYTEPTFNPEESKITGSVRVTFVFE